jgi:hypothetical protein
MKLENRNSEAYMCRNWTRMSYLDGDGEICIYSARHGELFIILDREETDEARRRSG